jgi:hypothetical protein
MKVCINEKIILESIIMPVADFADLDEGNPFADEDIGEGLEAVAPITPAKPSKPIVGIIYPPPEVRSKIFFTKVLKNG